MPETAESVIVEIQARMEGFTPAITQGTRTFTTAMTDVERSASRAEGAIRQSSTKIVESHQRMSSSGMILQHVVRASADQFAAGAPLATIFAQHVASIGEAAALSGSSMGRFGAFMAGPWGLVVSGGVAVLTALFTAHRNAAEEAHKHESFEQTLIRALNGEADAVDKVTQSMHQRNDAVREAIALDTERIARQQADTGIEAQVSQNELTRLHSELVTARSDLAATRGPHVGRAAQEAAAGQALDAQARITALTAQITAAEANISGVQGRLADLHTQQDRTLSTAEGRTKVAFDAIQSTFETAIRHAREMARGNPAELARINAIATVAENRLTQARLNGEAAARRQDQAQRDLNRDYSAVPFSEVRNRIIANEAPAHIGGYNALAYNTSATHNAAGVYSPQQLIDMTVGQVLSFQANVMRPLTRGRRGPGDVGSTGAGAYQFEHDTLQQNARQTFGAGYLSQRMTPENQDRIAETLYNRVRGNPAALRTTWAAFQPGHQGPGDNAASEAERQAREAIALADRRRQDEEHFQQELTGLNADLANARRQQVQTVEQAAGFEIDQIEEQRVQRNQRLQAEADERSHRDEANRTLYQAEAASAIAINDQTAEIKKATTRTRLQQQLDEQRIEIAQSEIRDQQSILQARGALARTVAERRDIELQLLELAHQERLSAIQKQRIRTLDPAQIAQLDRDQAAENTRHDLARQGVNRQYQGPLAQFFEQVPQGADAMNRALQGVAVDGLQQLNDGLAQAASRFLHLGGVAGSVLNTLIADMIQLILRQAELAAFGGSNGGGIFASIFGGGVGKGGGGGDPFQGALKNLVPGFGGGKAIGGPVMAGTPYLVGEKGPEMFVPGQHGTIVPQGKAISFNGASARPAPQITYITQELHLDLTNAVMTPQLVQQMNDLADQAAARGAQGGVAMAEARMYLRARQAL